MFTPLHQHFTPKIISTLLIQQTHTYTICFHFIFIYIYVYLFISLHAYVHNHFIWHFHLSHNIEWKWIVRTLYALDVGHIKQQKKKNEERKAKESTSIKWKRKWKRKVSEGKTKSSPECVIDDDGNIVSDPLVSRVVFYVCFVLRKVNTFSCRLSRHRINIFCSH